MDRVTEMKEAIYKQANLIDKKDLYYKYDDFKKGKKNIVLVSGYSGSGKSTLANELAAESGAHKIEMDDFVKKVDSNPKHKIVEEYFEKNPQMRGKVNEATQYHYFDDFYNHAKDYAKRHPKEKFVFEGIQLLGKNDYEDLPRVVKGTGMIHSNARAHKRMFQTKFKRVGFSEGLNSALHPKVNNERFLVRKLMDGYNPAQVDDLITMRKNSKLGQAAAGVAGVATGAYLTHRAYQNMKKIKKGLEKRKQEKERKKVDIYKNNIQKAAYEMMEGINK
jgi:predicted kinase